MGGYSSFNVDVTAYLNVGENTIVVNALDGQNDERIPCGNQRSPRYKEGHDDVIGIWQSVWLEFTGKSYINNCRITPATKQHTFILEGNIWFQNPCGEHFLEVSVTYKGKSVANYKYRANQHYILSLPIKTEYHTWNILDGNLYDIVVRLTDEVGKPLDEIKTYSAFREIELKDKKLFINEKEAFIKAIADRGIFSKGSYTAPSLDAIKQELINVVSLGFNAVLTNGKVPEPMYLYVADMLGLMVIYEYPSEHNLIADNSAESVIFNEWQSLIMRDYGHPSIIIWVPNVKYCGSNSDFIKAMYDFTKHHDLTRPTIDNIKGVHYKTDINSRSIKTNVHQEFFKELTTLKNGNVDMDTQVVDRENHKEEINALTLAMDYPLFISSIGGCEQGSISDVGEKNFLSEYGKIVESVYKAGAIGFCYEFLTDFENDNTGIFAYDRNVKLSRNGVATLQRINGLVFKNKKECSTL